MKLSELQSIIHKTYVEKGDMDVHLIVFSERGADTSYWCSAATSRLSNIKNTDSEPIFVLACHDKLKTAEQVGEKK